MEGKKAARHGPGSTFTLRGVVIPSTVGLMATAPKSSQSIASADTSSTAGGASAAAAAARPTSAASQNSRSQPRRDLQVVITSDGWPAAQRPATAAAAAATPTPSGEIQRQNGRRVPRDPHADKFLSRGRGTLDGALDAVVGMLPRDATRPRPGASSMMYGVRRLRPATAPVGHPFRRAPPNMDLAATYGSVASFNASEVHAPERFRSSASSSSIASTASTMAASSCGGDARGGLRFSRLTAARPVLASPHRRVQNPNRHRYDPTAAHFAPLQTYNTNAAPIHRSHLNGIASLRGRRHQTRIGCILADGLRDRRVEPTLGVVGSELDSEPPPRRPVFC